MGLCCIRLKRGKGKYLLTQTELKLELLALKWVMAERFRSCLFSAKMQVYTDSRNLTLWRKANLGAIEQRWIAQMSVFDYTIHHKPGKANAPVDYLSRYATGEPAESDEDGDVPICSIDATSIPVVFGLFDFGQLHARLGADEVLSET